jgi:DNA-binding MarR family transcriptional regulator
MVSTWVRGQFKKSIMKIDSHPQTSDLELRAHEDHHASLRLWLRLLSCTTLIEDTIRSNLREDFGITLPRFDLMAQLERHPDGLSMGELSRRMMVTGGNITSIVDQLENEKLVIRLMSEADRRSYTVRLTLAGRQAFTRMAQAHEQWVVQLFGDVSERQQSQLHSLLGHLKTSIHQSHATPSIAKEHP